MRPIVTLTTDFGHADPYVAAMKGVILSISPDAALVDVTHSIQPQRIVQAAYVTQTAWPLFPAGAVHIAVVDPDVGTARRALCIVTPRGVFIGPDNGVLSAALPDAARTGAGETVAPVPVPAHCKAYAITERRYLREPVSATFHGRDVFAPAAAHVSMGVPPSDLGEPVDALLALPPLRARRRADGALEGRVLHIDRFGNVITDARAEDLSGGAVAVDIVGEVVYGPVRTYADATGPVALVGSGGYLEVALPSDSAAARLGVDIGDPITVRARG